MSLPSLFPKMESCSEPVDVEPKPIGCDPCVFVHDWSDDEPRGWLECKYCGEHKELPRDYFDRRYEEDYL
jgi:hypothetical protein